MITVLAGDGIGPEVIAEGLKVLAHFQGRGSATFELHHELFGGGAIDATGSPLPEQTLQRCLSSDAVLLGAVGAPKYDDPRATVRPEQGLLGLRKQLGVFANLRPVRAWTPLLDSTPLKRDLVQGVDLIVVRELTGGLYFGEPRGRSADGNSVVDTLTYTREEITRILHVAFRLARQRRQRVTSVDKANVLTSSRLWRELAIEVGKEYPDIALEHALVDAASMQLIRMPSRYDVLVMENLFGDILSDEASVLAGSLGMLPSASLGEGTRGLYEPVHGSAPDISGQGLANPIGTILSVALMLRHSFGMEDEARAVESAVGGALDAGCRTRDIAAPNAPYLHTSEMGDEVVRRLAP
jgi:3-isopropylmalate dehydrogenase